MMIPRSGSGRVRAPDSSIPSTSLRACPELAEGGQALAFFARMGMTKPGRLHLGTENAWLQTFLVPALRKMREGPAPSAKLMASSERSRRGGAHHGCGDSKRLL